MTNNTPAKFGCLMGLAIFGGLAIAPLGGCTKEATSSTSASTNTSNTASSTGKANQVSETTPQTILNLPDPLEHPSEHASGSLDAGDYRRVLGLVKRNLPLFNACYSRERKREPSLAGKLTVALVVGPGPQGLVKKAHVREQTISNDNVARCVVGSLRAFKFPRGGRQELSFVLPFIFR